MHLDPAPALLLVLGAAAYARGVRRLARRGRRWAPSRSLAFALGLVALVVATQTTLAARDTTSFPSHVAQHLILAMVAPALLALGAPVTLALQTAGPGVRRALRRVLRSRAARVLGHPALTWPVWALSLWVLYATPLFDLSIRDARVHDLVHVHFLVSGAAFLWPVVAADPVPHRPSPPARLALVGLAIPLHAFLGLSLLVRSEPLAGQTLAGTHLGGGIMWAAGDLVATGVLALVVRDWVREDGRQARREDRRTATPSAA